MSFQFLLAATMVHVHCAVSSLNIQNNLRNSLQQEILQGFGEKLIKNHYLSQDEEHQSSL